LTVTGLADGRVRVVGHAARRVDPDRY
jgi:hypothetical protein